MENTPTPQQNLSVTSRMAASLTNSLFFKILLIGFIILILLIPGAMIRSLIQERHGRQTYAIDDIREKWGENQLVSGPVLNVPVESHGYDANNRPVVHMEYLHILPDRLDIQGDIKPEMRHRGIFTATLYRASLDIKGKFRVPSAGTLQAAPEDIHWEKAFLSMGMSDLSGIRQQIRANINEKEMEITPGIESQDVFKAGISILCPSGPDQDLAFHFQMQLNGSDQLHFLPLGKSTSVTLRSPWPAPSFSGRILPVEHEITEKGFTANWQVSQFNRNYPQYWMGKGQHLEQSSFGVDMLQGIDIYKKATRTAKYAMMFIIFSFAAFFIAEILSRNRVHPVQYLLIGFAIIMFYVLLLALGEHIGFNAAYCIASCAVILLVGTYTRNILGTRMALVAVFLLACLYGYLFVTLQLEDYALLMGSIGLFLLLGTVMFVTRNVNWYGMQQQKSRWGINKD